MLIIQLTLASTLLYCYVYKHKAVQKLLLAHYYSKVMLQAYIANIKTCYRGLQSRVSNCQTFVSHPFCVCFLMWLLYFYISIYSIQVGISKFIFSRCIDNIVVCLDLLKCLIKT